MSISNLICELLKIGYTIDFSNPKNFVKLLDLLFRYKQYFHLNIKYRQKNFLEDTLRIFYEELEEMRIEHPLQIKEFSCMVKNEYWE